MSEVMRNAGDVVWDELFIVNPKGTVIDVLAMCIEINLYEDIFSPSMYGNIIMSDTHNLLTNIPIVGQEYLFVKFHTPGAKETTIDRMFKINKVSDRNVDGDKQTYILHFISYDAHLDLLWTYTGTVGNKPANTIASIIKEMRTRTINVNSSYYYTPTQMIPELFKQKENTSTDPKINAKIAAHNARYANIIKQMGSLEQIEFYSNDSNTGRYHSKNMPSVRLTSPQWGAFETIGYIANKSYLSDKIDSDTELNNDTFIFYDTNKGYQFRAIGDIFTPKYRKYTTQTDEITQGSDYVEYKDTFIFDHSQPAGNPGDSLPKIHDFRYVNTLDMMELISNHGGGHTVYNHDLIFKTFSLKKFRAIDHTQMVLNNWSILGLHGNSNGMPIKTTSPEVAESLSQELACVSKYPDNETAISYGNMRYGSSQMYRENNETPAQYRLPLLNKLNMLRIDIDVWGRTWLIPGDVIWITFGNYTQKNASSDDNKMSGKYVITAIHHRLSQFQHMMTMQVATDSTQKNLERL